MQKVTGTKDRYFSLLHPLMMLMLCLCALVSCSDSDDDDDAYVESVQAEEEDTIPERTVMVYVMGENNLSSYASSDIAEMVQGSLYIDEDEHNLIVFVDDNSSTPPYIMRIVNGQKEVDSVYNAEGNEFYASHPDSMAAALTYMMETWPAKSYGLVLWGHSSGWLISSDTIKTTKYKAYGYDSGKNAGTSGNKWINIPTLANVLETLPEHLDFIFADCCNFQCAEVAYELKDVTDIIIGSPAEITGVGAPYKTVIPALFDTSDTFYEGVIDAYYEQIDGDGNRVPLSAIKTSAMSALAEATADIIPLVANPVDVDGIIYYRGYTTSAGWAKPFTDANNLMVMNVSDDTALATWQAALDEAVIYKVWTDVWTTSSYVNFDFDYGEETYGGMSMFIPQEIFDTYSSSYDYNEIIKDMAWYYAAGIDKY